MRLRVRILTLAAFTFLSGCAYVDTLKETAVARARDLQTETAEVMMFNMCYGMSIGEWRRRFGNDSTKATAWAVLCSESSAAPPTSVPPEAVGASQ